MRRRPARAGLSESELNAEISVATEITTANCRKNSPEMPTMNIVGTKTEVSTSAMEMRAPPTSSMVFRAASFGDRPSTM